MLFAHILFSITFGIATCQTIPHLTLQDLNVIAQTINYQIKPLLTTCAWNELLYCVFCNNPVPSTVTLLTSLSPSYLQFYTNINTNACPTNTTALAQAPLSIVGLFLANACSAPYATCDPLQPDLAALSTFANCAMGEAIHSMPYGGLNGVCKIPYRNWMLRVAGATGFSSDFIAKFNSSTNSVCEANGGTTGATSEFDVMVKTVCVQPGFTCEPSCPFPPFMTS